MLENLSLKTNFVGKDGFFWWIGQIPKQKNWIDNIAERPTESNEEFQGFGYRYKVRILGYHPSNADDLSDEQLPWASVLFPVTAGSGQGGCSQSPNLRQGNFVYGFFLDGEDGQQPVITGVFGVNQYAEVKRNSEVKKGINTYTKEFLEEERLSNLKFNNPNNTKILVSKATVSVGEINAYYDPDGKFIGARTDSKSLTQQKQESKIGSAEWKRLDKLISIEKSKNKGDGGRNSSVQPDNIIKGDGEPPKPFEPLSGVDSTSEDVSRNILPVNQDQASTDGVIVESNIGQDQIVSGTDEEADIDSKVEEIEPKGNGCDLTRELPIQTITKNLLNRKQRLEKAKKHWKTKISTKVGNVKVDVTGALKNINEIDGAITEAMNQATEDITGEIKRVTDGIQKNVNQKINFAMAKAYSSLPISKLTEAKKKEDKAFDDLSCAFGNIAANLSKMVGSFLSQAINKLINAPLCAINNFVSSLLGKVSGIIDGAVGAILGPIKSFLSSVGGVNDIVDDLTDVASSVLSFLSCAAAPSCSEVQSWSQSGGIVAPDILGTLDIGGIIGKAKGVAAGIKDSIDQFKNIGSSIKGVMENADFSDVIGDAVASCNVGPLRCGPPTIEFFGGGGSGAAGNAIIGAAGTLLGVDIILPGSGYTDVPFVSFKDSCGKGGGATGTAVIEDGKVVDVIMNDSGTGYITKQDGSLGGDGTTWAEADETTIKRSDGSYDTPYSPGEVITVCPGDEVTEPGGKVILISGEDCIQITAKPPSPPPEKPVDPTLSTGEYPVVLVIDSINVVDGGFNYDCSKDTVVVEPNNGAKLSICGCDSLGTINKICVDDSGSGFTDDPNIYIQSGSGYNAKLVPTFKVRRVEDPSQVSPASVIQVVDCVGKI
tara:strand:- start:1433 stop:4081 length:2649 start_codon:yes stop_codon:yes gene_type:complete